MLYLCGVFQKRNIMATITLEYDYRNIRAKEVLEHILSLGLFKSAVAPKEYPISEKREKLDRELENYLIDLSSFKFSREEANIYE
jgi:DNA-binding transcriptional regulator YhcF (GntR family)